MQISNFKFSCVLDESPLMAVQSYIWLNSLLSYNIDPSNIFIHTIGGITNEYFTYLKDKGINIIECEVFDERNRYCNKLVQFSTFEEIEDYEYVFLMDCDTAVISLEGLELSNNVYGKIVDFPNPPLKLLKEIFKSEGFKIHESNTSFPLNNENITDWNNCNGGVYIIHRDFLPSLAPKWKNYALKCMDEKESFTIQYKKHADQVGFALAMASLNEKVSHLNIEWNFPIHMEPQNRNVIPKIFHFHKEITKNLRLKPVKNKLVDAELEKINYRLNKVLESNYDLHPRDIGEEKLVIGMILNDFPNILKELVNISRENIGFFTSHFSRVFEYSWILFNLNERQDISVIDIGAGVCPLPICLADRKFKVTTIDSHPLIRKEENRKKWNEWGYLDYSRYRTNIQSLNIDFQKFRPSELFDVIYSVSVIEHLSRKDRKNIIKKSACILKKGGELLLTVDIIPNTNKIWNMSEDRQVESSNLHGEIINLKKEIRRSGFEIISEKIQRNIPYSRTDVLYLKCRLKQKNLWTKIINNV